MPRGWGTIMIKRLRHHAGGTGSAGLLCVSLLGAGLLGGCAALNDPDGFWNNATAWQDSSYSDGAMLAFAKGDLPKAEQLAGEALRRNPKDAYAALTAGLVQQALGRNEAARPYYEAILATRPQGAATIGLDGFVGPRTLLDIARAHVALMERPRINAQQAAAAQQALSGAPARRTPVSAADAGREMPSFGGPQGNIATRFLILRRLYDEGLITPDEFTQRRRANAGALLPYSTAGGGAGLERPIPAADQIVQRMQALNRNLESRSISPKEHQAERNVILEALLPAQPRLTGNPPMPPRDMLQAASAIGMLERLREADIVTPDEVARERAAIEKLLEVKTAEEAARAQPMPASASPTPVMPAETLATAGTAAAKAVGGMGIHLASLRTEDQVKKEWAVLQKKIAELKSMSYTTAQIDLGPGKGVFLRLIAGPMGADAADKMCKSLKLKRQFCEPAPFG